MSLTYKNRKILKIDNIEYEMLWAKDVLKRAENSWPDLVDIDTAIMILEQTEIIFIEADNHDTQYYCDKCFYKNKKNIDLFPKPKEKKCNIGACGYFMAVLKK